MGTASGVKTRQFNIENNGVVIYVSFRPTTSGKADATESQLLQQ